MSLLQMSFSGGIFIIVVVIIRAVAINKLPKKTFLILWGIVLIRLLIPFSIPSMFSVYSLIGQNTTASAFSGTGNVIPSMLQGQFDAMHRKGQLPADNISTVSVWFVIWFIGMVFMAVFFVISYLHCRIEFQASLPVHNDFVEQWFKEYSLKQRPLSIRQSDKISSPLTYGIFHPVILMPKNTDWENTKQLQYILLHEYVHIYRYDVITKLITAFALCIHWFNPMVYVMYILCNCDIELACDESVVRKFGESCKSAYALMLISMEEKKSGLVPFCNNLSKNSMEERITAIMKTKKASLLAIIIAGGLIAGMAATFATSAADNTGTETNIPDTYNDVSVKNLKELQDVYEPTMTGYYKVTSQNDMDGNTKVVSVPNLDEEYVIYTDENGQSCIVIKQLSKYEVQHN